MRGILDPDEKLNFNAHRYRILPRRGPASVIFCIDHLRWLGERALVPAVKDDQTPCRAHRATGSLRAPIVGGEYLGRVANVAAPVHTYPKVVKAWIQYILSMTRAVHPSVHNFPRPQLGISFQCTKGDVFTARVQTHSFKSFEKPLPSFWKSRCFMLEYARPTHVGTVAPGQVAKSRAGLQRKQALSVPFIISEPEHKRLQRAN